MKFIVFFVQDENCNFCADFVYAPPEVDEQPISRAPSRASTVNASFPYNGCQQQLITTKGVLTDCITRARNLSSRQSNYEVVKVPKRKSSLDPYVPSIGEPKSEGVDSRLRRHSSASEMTHFRSINIADGWVVIDVKSKSRSMSG